MTDPVRKVYARLGAARTRLHAPPRTLPVVVVPDFLGTRLMTPDGEALVWNPLGAPFGNGPRGFKVDLERLARVDVPLVPAERFGCELAADRDRVRHIAHAEALVGDVYGLLLTELADLRTDALVKHKTQVRVYCCGYDWRQDNTRAALRLAAVVDEALRETGERKVVIVAHGLGGAVARTYCRALGGEGRVLQMFLVGAATLGAPEAYRALKDGLGGLYAKDFVDRCAEADARGAAFEATSMAAEVVDAAVSSAGPAGFAADLFGGLYTLLCVSAARHPSRDETRSLVRQFPSVYQMMPGAAYCNAHPGWLRFDPVSTGHPPTGYTVVLPAAHDALARAALDASEATVASAQASRNVDTLPSLVARATDAFSTAMVGAKLGARAARVFVDCRSPDALYQDIYTGLLDVVEERPLCAAHLAAARHLDRALTLHPRDTPPTTGVRLVSEALHAAAPVGEALRAWADAYGDDVGRSWSRQRAEMDATWRGADQEEALRRYEEERADRADRRRREREERERARREDEAAEREPEVYLHPATVCIAGSGRACRGAGSLVALRMVSRDDSNVVRWIRLPGPPDDGDGQVPFASASIGGVARSAPLLGDVTRVTGAGHAELPNDDRTLQRIREELDALLPRFIAS